MSSSKELDSTGRQVSSTLWHLQKAVNMKEEMIRDRVVVGIRDSTLSEKLQMDPALTLESAKKAIRQSEAVHEQQLTLKQEEGAGNIDFLQRKSTYGKSTYGRGKGHSRNPKKTDSQDRPRRAVAVDGRREECPAKDAECHHCKRKGHYSAVCFKKSVSSVQQEDDDNLSDNAFLDAVTHREKESWTHSQWQGDTI